MASIAKSRGEACAAGRQPSRAHSGRARRAPRGRGLPGAPPRPL